MLTKKFVVIILYYLIAEMTVLIAEKNNNTNIVKQIVKIGLVYQVNFFKKSNF